MKRNELVVDSYFNMLKHLSMDDKLDLIARLSKSIKETKSKKVTASDFSGKWKSELSPEEMAEEIRKSRYFDRKLEQL